MGVLLSEHFHLLNWLFFNENSIARWQQTASRFVGIWVGVLRTSGATPPVENRGAAFPAGGLELLPVTRGEPQAGRKFAPGFGVLAGKVSLKNRVGNENSSDFLLRSHQNVVMCHVGGAHAPVL
jgi:hypothetical protein